MDTSRDETLAAKREARRQKLLANAKDRMSRITGRESKDETESINQNVSKERIVYPDPEIERDVFVSQTAQFPPEMLGASDMDAFESLLNSMRQQQQQQQQNQGDISPNANMTSFNAFAQFGNLDDGTGMSNRFFANFNTENSPKVPETRLQKCLKTKIHIGMLSIFTYLFITFTSFHCNVFLIFLIWEITEILLLRQHENNSTSIFNVVFMMAGVSPTKINIFLKWIQLLNKILRDVAIFIFFFVITHIFYMNWNGLSIIPSVRESPLSQADLYDNNDENVFEHFDL